ncbi:hypothetical protein Kalk_13120 [Ketobacter alkanivorans]|uniref:Autotransporter domain-containing protein n=2 Tax=Ketobacter alkanivorans TaxID=1917421 RepID=A0A2K9LLT5_9GAMM|nr:hypothetical protein Kalk_13120 [Ketobacter alkanivorans]
MELVGSPRRCIRRFVTLRNDKMNSRIAPFAVLTLAAAIASEVQAEVVAVADTFSGVINQSQSFSVASILQNDRLNEVMGQFGQVFVEINQYSNDFYDSNGQPADPFDESQTEDFVIVSVCVDDLANGSATLNESGNFVYTPDEDYLGTDSMYYVLEEYVVDSEGEGGISRISSDGATIEITTSEQAASANPLVSGRNRQRVASALTSLCSGDNAISSNLQARCDELNDAANTNPSALQGMISQITPDEILSLRRLTSDVSRQHTDLVYRQQINRRRKHAAPEITLNEGEFSLLNVTGGNAGEGISPWSGFASVQYDETDFGGDDLEDPYDTETSSITLGSDYRLNQSWILGLALAWSEQDVTYNETAGTLDASLYNLIGYASYMGAFINVDLQLSYLQADQDITRNIQYSGFDTATNANTDTQVASISTQLDWNWSKNSWNLRPYLRLDYLRAQIDGFRETGGMGWAVEAGDQDMAQWNTGLGLDTSYAFSCSWGVLVPSLNLSANSQSSKDYRPVEFHFIDDGSGAGDFTLLTEGEDSLFYQYEVSAVAVMAGGASAYFSYRGTAEFDDIESNQISLGGRYEF